MLEHIQKINPTSYDFQPKLKACTAVDLFCGVGGLTYGLSAAGITVAAGLDIDESCQFPYERNNNSKFICKSIKDISGLDLLKLFPEGHIKVLVGCAPCQDFSRYSRAKRAEGSTRWELLKEFGRIVRELQPEVVSIENVPEIESHVVYKDFINLLDELGYKIAPNRAYCPEYGVAQTRERTVLLASKLGEISLIKPIIEDPQKYPTVFTAIGNMEKLEAGTISSDDPLHRSPNLSELNLMRIKHSKPGGTWRDWPNKLIAKCHKQKNGSTYSGVYGRMEWDKPSPTLTTQFFGYGSGRFGHPEQDRAISLREGALLQSFPKQYIFVEPKQKIIFNKIGRMIGNAVPPRLGVAIGQSIRDHIEEWRQKNVQTTN